MRIYEASWDGNYEFRCEIDEDASMELASMSLNLSEVRCAKTGLVRCSTLVYIFLRKHHVTHLSLILDPSE